MKYYKYILILLMTMGLSVSAAQETINIKLSDINENGNVCDGQCPFIHNDYYNYFWIYDVSDILSTDCQAVINPFITRLQAI